MPPRTPQRTKKRTGKPIHVVAAVIQRNGRFLVCQRRAGDAFPMKWEFPGGKVCRGETERAALRRELREELELQARIGREVYRTRHQYRSLARPVDLAFYAATIGGQRPINRAFQKLLWVAPQNLARLDFLEADRNFIQQLARGRTVLGPVRPARGRHPRRAPVR
jgi:8-oxo-dGTP diphosphatase